MVLLSQAAASVLLSHERLSGCPPPMLGMLRSHISVLLSQHHVTTSHVVPGAEAVRLGAAEGWGCAASQAHLHPLAEHTSASARVHSLPDRLGMAAMPLFQPWTAFDLEKPKMHWFGFCLHQLSIWGEGEAIRQQC